MTNNTPTELLPAKTIEARWGITPDELRRAADNGQITEYRLGSRTIRYSPDEILDYMTRDTTSDTTTAPPLTTTIARPGLTTDDYDKLTYQGWLNLRAEWLRLVVGPHIINPTDDSDPSLRYLQEVGLNASSWSGDYPRGSYIASTGAIAKRLNLKSKGKNPGDRIVRIRNKAVRNGYLTVITPGSGRRPSVVALSFDFMRNNGEPITDTTTTPNRPQISPRDRLARIIAELTNLHNQLPH